MTESEEIAFKIVRQYAMGLSQTEKALLEHMIVAVQKAENEACAKLAQDYHKCFSQKCDLQQDKIAGHKIAQAIRARSSATGGGG